ncbi:MAG: chemotaxis protein [Oceanicaulis sp.]|jgi:methyl-accepting chemotaxis protein|uniref:methyl-accepting chemotaxis protein n=1 Tax=unclassified Oceanicaulis TaxID=2632123 RepID=UPI000C664468|nr:MULTISPECIES: methyl-accepting chemotaxis protein [unclassified Oceanicaulis]MAB69202.1 chemotaxis protein [Oceanicaulis sp.]MBC38458.1 chemotaxis protein [Oceanicaulis sp.]MBG35453.1 chemotaxis protein [Oceanicaulis sp.]HBU62085.1 chemotaxis protein [Oceanicaulis sp.]HCR94515.1 chemotaxis protein [Oceanicaulis sp.]
MLSFGRKPDANASATLGTATPANAPAPDWANALSTAIREIRCGRSPELSGLPPQAASALAELHQELRARNAAELERTVNASVQNSEAMAAVARATGEVRKMDTHVSGMSTAVEELDFSIHSITKLANTGADSLSACVEQSQTGLEAVRLTRSETEQLGGAFETITGRVTDLEQASRQIAEIVDTIAAIADQTNLLALNATIEAARAGEAGRGFAVVAGEVKALSGQTAKATEDIRQRMDHLQQQVAAITEAVSNSSGSVQEGINAANASENAVNSVTDTMRESARIVSEIAQLITEQSSATTNLSSSVSEIASGATRARERVEHVVEASAGTESTIGQTLAALSERNIDNFVLHCAKSDHLLWKKRLNSMLVGATKLSESELSDHRSCRLGKWYESARSEYGRIPAFQAIEAPHARAHECGKRAARLCAQGDYAGAEAAVEEMEAASEEVIKTLDRLIGELSADTVSKAS